MSRIVLIVGFLLIAVGMGLALFYSPVQLRAEYSTQISVDKSDKIKNAISNVVSDLKKRDFVLIYLEVNWHPLSKTYVVYAKGRDNFINYKP